MARERERTERKLQKRNDRLDIMVDSSSSSSPHDGPVPMSISINELSTDQIKGRTESVRVERPLERMYVLEWLILYRSKRTGSFVPEPLYRFPRRKRKQQ